MAALKIPPSWVGVGALVTNKPLSDVSLPNAPQTLSLPSQSQSISLPAGLGTVTVAADEKCAFAVINAATDQNVDGYLSFPTSAPAQPTMPALEAPVPFDSTQAYVILTGLSATGKVSDQITLGSDEALGLDGSAAVDVSMCLSFPPSTPVWSALVAAAARFKTIFSSAELRSLGPGETVSFGFQGDLGLSATLTLSSLAAVAASAIEDALNLSGPFQLTFDPSATLSVNVSVQDGYRVYAQDTPAGTQFTVTKQNSTSLGIDGGAGITAQASDQDILNWANALVAQLPGAVAGDAAKLVTSLQRKIPPVVTAQFTYSWTRLTSNSLAVRFTVPDAVLDTYLPKIIAMNLTDIISAPSSSGIMVDRWLGQKTVETDIGFGLSFGFAGKTFLVSTDSTTEHLVEIDSGVGNGPPQRQFAYLGKRGYTAAWFGKTFTNYVEIDASTPKFLPAPSAADFDVGLSVAFTWSESLGSLLLEAADHGSVIGAFATDDVLAAVASLTVPGVDPGAAATGVVNIKVPDPALSAMMPTLTNPALLGTIAPNAIARALVCTPDCQQFVERSQPNQRQHAYAQAFCDYLHAPQVDNNTVPYACSQRMSGLGCPTALINIETARSLSDPNSYALFPPWTAGAIIADNNAEDFQDAAANGLARAFLLLQQRSENYAKLFDDVVGALSGLGGTNFGCRVLAAVLYIAAGQTPGALGLVERTVTISWKDAAGKTRSIVSNGT